MVADIMSELLAQSLMNAEEQKRFLHVFERAGVEWLRQQWKLDQSLNLNMWVASRYVWSDAIDLHGRMLDGIRDDQEFSVRR